MAVDPIDWNPACMLRDRAEADDSAPRFALIILNQPLTDMPTLKTLWRNASLKVAADGGANRILDVCQVEQQQQQSSSLFDDLDIIIGDLDSLTPAARDHFTTRPRPTRVIHDRDQESTDFGKAVRHVRENHHDGNNDNNDNNNNNGTANTTTSLDIVALGGLGGRVDQALSQLHHLHLFQADPHYAEGRMFLVGGESLTFLLKASGGRSHRVRVRERGAPRDDDVFDKYVGIVPVREPSVITTRGLEWDVEGWSTEMGGRVSTSNHVLPETEVVEVETTKDVLFTIALRQSR